MDGRQIVAIVFVIAALVLLGSSARHAGSPGGKARRRTAMILGLIGIGMGFWYLMGS